jgi:hypothetical protein
VTFKPSAAGSRTATLTVADTAGGAPNQTASHTGTGVAGVISAAPSPVAFGSQATAAGAVSQTVQVSNAGPGAVAFTTDTVTGTNFVKGTDSCAGTTVQPGNTCSVVVTFTPTAANATTASTSRTGNLAIASNAATSPVNVAISGTARQAIVGFTGSTALTTGTANRNVKNALTTISNTGTAPLVISSIAIATNTGQTNPGTYSVANPGTGTPACPIGGTGLAAGAACQVTVTYTPPATGPLNTINGTLTVTDTGAFAATQTRGYTGN